MQGCEKDCTKGIIYLFMYYSIRLTLSLTESKADLKWLGLSWGKKKSRTLRVNIKKSSRISGH